VLQRVRLSHGGGGGVYSFYITHNISLSFWRKDHEELTGGGALIASAATSNNAEQ